MKQKGLTPILIILLIALAVGGYLFIQKQPRPVQPQPQPSPSPIASDETANPDLIGANWKIYEKKEIGLSLEYPSYWEIKELNNDKYEEGNWSGIEIKGKEGEVEMLWGWGFGGACPEGYEDISIKNKKLHTCHGLDQEGYERWNQIGGVKGKQMGNFGRVGFTAKATAYPPSQTTRDTILKIISSINLAAWE